MSRRRWWAVVGALACLGGSPALVDVPAAAEPGDPALRSVLEALGPGDTATVVVTLKRQADLRKVSAPGRKARLRAVVTELRTTADQAQTGIRAALDDWAAQGVVASYEPLWVLDAVSVTATADVITALTRRTDVSAVEPDPVDVVPAAATQNQVAIGAPDVWDLGDTGAGVVVATLDSGADVTHPDLQASWRGGTNSWFDPYGQHPSGPVDLTGHGTATLGAIVGGDASGAAIGTAPGARWIAARIFDDRGAATTTAVHQAFQWLLDPDGDPATADAPQVVNGSWSLGSAPGCDLAFQPDVQALVAAGILPVFAAGNFGSGAGSGVSPANYPESLAVGALATTGGVLGSSSRGPSGCGGRTGVYPDLVAPGEDIPTTDLYGLYQVASGTSMAAPHAAGALALLLAARGGLTAEQQRQALVGTAADLGPAGPDDDYGAGRLDALAAYQWVSAPTPDFTVTVAPAAATVQAGAGTGFDVTVTADPGFTGDVALAAELPPGLAGALVPATITGGSGTSRLTVTTPTQGAEGDHQLTVTATSGGVVHTGSATLSVTPPPPPRDRIELSTRGAANPPGLTGRADDADVLAWDGTTYARVVDASMAPYSLPAGANLDGFSRTGPTSFYASFAADVRVPGIGAVQDEDVVLYDGQRWRLWFDGTARRLTDAGLDLDAVSVVGDRLYFSTLGNVSPPGVAGKPDDADIYLWDGTRFSRVWDASTHGLATGADVDGLDLVDPGSFWLSFAATTTLVPTIGAVEDEDVVRLDSGVWSGYFDGTAHGLTSDALDVDAFDVP